jgi:hypothetical protein
MLDGLPILTRAYLDIYISRAVPLIPWGWVRVELTSRYLGI